MAEVAGNGGGQGADTGKAKKERFVRKKRIEREDTAEEDEGDGYSDTKERTDVDNVLVKSLRRLGRSSIETADTGTKWPLDSDVIWQHLTIYSMSHLLL